VRFGRQLAGLVVGAAILTALLLGPIKPVLDRLLSPGAAGTYDIGPAFRRIGEALAVLGGVVLWRRSRPARRPPASRRRGAWLLGGFLFGAVSLSIFLATEVGAKAFRFEPSPLRQWPVALAAALLIALLVGLIEESIFRGFILEGLRREHALGTALAVSSVLYAACHYFRATVLVAAGPDLTIGWTALSAHLRAVADPSHGMQLLGLTLVGGILAMAKLSSGTLACAIGWHAGWVFVVKGAGIVLDPNPGIGWLYGPNGAVGRPSVLVALLAILFAIALPRARAVFGAKAEVERT
jgi:membrane protease YdiL (CAAX protease family)